MLTEGQMFDLFDESVATDAPDPTFLDELFALLIDEVASRPLPRPIQRLDRGRPIVRWTVLIAASVAIALLGLGLLGRPIWLVGPPNPTPSPSSIPGSPLPRLTQTFTSPLNGFSIGYPSGQSIQAATRTANVDQRASSPDDPWVDNIIDILGTGLVSVWSVPLTGTPEQRMADELADSLLTTSGFAVCGSTMTTVPVVIDGHAGTIDTHCDAAYLDAFAILGGREYRISLQADPPNMDWFQEILASVRLHPEDALTVRPSESPAQSPGR